MTVLFAFFRSFFQFAILRTSASVGATRAVRLETVGATEIVTFERVIIVTPWKSGTLTQPDNLLIIYLFCISAALRFCPTFPNAHLAFIFARSTGDHAAAITFVGTPVPIVTIFHASCDSRLILPRHLLRTPSVFIYFAIFLHPFYAIALCQRRR